MSLLIGLAFCLIILYTQGGTEGMYMKILSDFFTPLVGTKRAYVFL